MHQVSGFFAGLVEGGGALLYGTAVNRPLASCRTQFGAQ